MSIVDVLPRANFRFNFADLGSQETLSTSLRGMLDWEKPLTAASRVASCVFAGQRASGCQGCQGTL